MTDAVKLTHPDTKVVVEADPEHVQRYTSQGWRPATVDAPAGNARLEAWQDFARSKGFADADIDGKTRDELRSALS